MSTPAPLCLTMGSPEGIGGEITLKSWLARKHSDVPVFFSLDVPERLREEAKRLELSVPVEEIATPSQAGGIFERALPVLPVSADKSDARAALESIKGAVSFALKGEIAGLVTNPVNKASISQTGIKFYGHTDYIAELCNAAGKAVMMLECEALRVVPASVHIPLREAGAFLSQEWLEHVGRTVDAYLRERIGISGPIVAFAGFNPHAGEEGILGNEEIGIIKPAVESLRLNGIDARGPFAADSLFHAEARKTYDAVVCMYHDQALIPFKSLAFYEGVNVTLGLPVVRVSPDHGTAEDIKGKGVARPDSLLAALRTAARMR
ncbi:MAG: 4-hydroxythreonine-4-phosphate dehydrogenase PdxA [Hyphomicrobiales bacterium]|nr:4-hydroxythreonine-4-phosphate dehydrogenase PdxA [Hyphomicrobiales bacterium]